ncbi:MULTISPECIES: glycosyltransferase [Thalassospira]|nr:MULTISPECIES: glycosyltransferase [Thalassospira]MBR9899389.1 glycosyltransferase [Rhodospirillales bacterium]
MPNTLVVIVAGRVSEWTVKGETPPGYFNPARGFSRIVVVSLAPDSPSEEDLQKLCGLVEYEFRSVDLLCLKGFARTMMLPPLVRAFVIRRLNVAFAEDEKVSVRGYGDTFAGMVASILGKHYQCKSVASIHTTHTYQPSGSSKRGKELLLSILESMARRYTHSKIDFLAPVYSPALETVPLRYHSKTHLIPNAVAVASEDVKANYQQAEKLFSLVTVGRLITGKSVLPILEAVQQTPFTTLTIIGDGPNRRLIENWIRSQRMSHRVKLVPRMENKELVTKLKNFDAFVGYTEFAEIPKTVIEAGLVGLPIVLNTPKYRLPKEYDGIAIHWVDGQPQSYAKAIGSLIDTPSDRELSGRDTREKFEILFDPDTSNKRMFQLLTAAELDMLPNHQTHNDGSNGAA